MCISPWHADLGGAGRWSQVVNQVKCAWRTSTTITTTTTNNYYERQQQLRVVVEVVEGEHYHAGATA